MNTIDNLITSVFNLFAGLFGFEGTESIGGEISRFFTETWNSITGVINSTIDWFKTLFTDPVDLTKLVTMGRNCW